MNPPEAQGPVAVLKALGVTVESAFIPFSRSRNKGQDTPNLNWKVTIKVNGNGGLVTDYMAGCAHCPGYNAKCPSSYHHGPRHWQRDIVAVECETGIAQRYQLGRFSNKTQRITTRDRSRPVRIEPSPADVLFALTMDSSVLDSGGFENWAADYGLDPDSRKAESTYRACLEIALNMRACFGPDGMAALQVAFQDY